MTGHALATFALFLAPLCLGCPGDPARSPTLMRPIDEAHAVSIMAAAFRDLKVEPERGRSIHIGPEGAKELILDVASKGHSWGIAFITSQDGLKLGEAVPRRRDGDSSLMYMHGVVEEEKDSYAIFLFAGDYMQDDLSGESHTATSIAAEQKLDLDTRDAIRLAQHLGWQ